eukprot:GDKJ01035617.1.p1 GENE.GDKJ01035617.1~~GDKJ01035617.1.p1  ORF type:complete len:173 (-),score=25.16 GDKJ01035617.1:84-602(-)
MSDCCSKTPFATIFGNSNSDKKKGPSSAASVTTSVQMAKHNPPTQAQKFQYVENLRSCLHRRAIDTFKNPTELQDLLMEIAGNLNAGENIIDYEDDLQRCYYWHGPVDARGNPRITYVVDGEPKDNSVMRLLVYLFARDDELDAIKEENKVIMMTCENPRCLRLLHIEMLDE